MVVLLKKEETKEAKKAEAAKAGEKKSEAKKAGEKKPEDKKDGTKAATDEEMASVVKEIEGAMFAVKFYPVAVDEASKDEAADKLVKIYNQGSETVRQLLLYMVHETLATSAELKMMHTFEYFKARNPALDPAQLRMSVYRTMFNYNTSIEGLAEVIRLLGRLKGSDDATKLLTYHFSHLCSAESESTHMLRAVIIDTLGKSDSHYALKSLLEYAKYTDNEHLFNRVVSALVEWEEKIDRLKLTDKEKEKLRSKLQEVVTKEARGSHYG